MWYFLTKEHIITLTLSLEILPSDRSAWVSHTGKPEYTDFQAPPNISIHAQIDPARD
jgi:hypothetical protein